VKNVDDDTIHTFIFVRLVYTFCQLQLLVGNSESAFVYLTYLQYNTSNNNK